MIAYLVLIMFPDVLYIYISMLYKLNKIMSHLLLPPPTSMALTTGETAGLWPAAF